jgi:hypothetical protein
MQTLSLEADEVQAVTLALWKLTLERPGWESYLKGIADKFTKGQFEAYRLMYVDQMTELLSGEPPPISTAQSQTQSTGQVPD